MSGSTRDRFSWRGKLLLAILAPLVVLGILEGSVRLFGMKPRRTDAPLVFMGADFSGKFPNVWDDELFWRMEAGAELPWSRRGEVWGEEHLNALGRRGPEVPREKPLGVRRVLCLGDSNTFGLGVPEHATFSHRLQRWLDTSTSGRFEVINGGIPGYSLWQMVRTFEVDGPALAPDVVIVYAGAWNDFTPAIGGPDSALGERLRKSKEGLGRLRLVQLLRSWFDRGDPAADQKKLESYRSAFVEEKKKPDGARVPLDEFERLLVALNHAVVARGARLVLVTPPAPLETRVNNKDGDLYAEALRDVARRRGVSLVDLRRLLGGQKRPDQELFCDFIHPSAEGHRLIFAALAERLAMLGLEPAIPAAAANIEPAGLALLSASEVRAGEPLAPAPSALVLEGKHVRTPCPCEIKVSGILVPPQSSLLVEFSHCALKPGDARPTTFRILAAPSGEPPQPILTRTYAASHRGGNPELCRADLSAFAGKTVTMVIEIAGSAACGYLSDVAIHPYR